MANYLFKGLCHVGIMTDNAEESVKWYCEKLGFRPWYAGKMGPMPLTFVEGYGLVIEFISAGKMAPGGPIAHIALEVLNIEDAVADLRAKGVHVETGVFGADMQVESVNDGPVTIILDSAEL